MRRLPLITASAVPLGCVREPVQTDARDVQVKDRNVKVNLKVPNLEGGEKKPYFLLCGYKDKTCYKPTSAFATDNIYKWEWENLKNLVRGSR